VLAPPTHVPTCRAGRAWRACKSGQRAQCRTMMHYNELVPAQASALVSHADRLRLAVAAYLARFKGTSRDHADSDLRCYLAWCAEQGLDPFLARRPHLELYIRWTQEVRRFKPSTVSRRFSVTAGFYRTCVIDGVLERSPPAPTAASSSQSLAAIAQASASANGAAAATGDTAGAGHAGKPRRSQCAPATATRTSA